MLEELAPPMPPSNVTVTIVPNKEPMAEAPLVLIGMGITLVLAVVVYKCLKK